MKFIDEVNITIRSGNGGNGIVSFRREKFVPRGGPDGGDGGSGGNVYFKATDTLNTLMHYRGKKNYLAQHGEDGRGSQCQGKSGENLILQVPVGTLVRNAETDEVLADLTNIDDQILILRGGRGGLGNVNFKSSINQAPRRATEGHEGKELEVKLELKLLADLALIGLPNAGKSTLISVLSAAKPKIADYPFTTLEPNLGVLQAADETLVVADIPGLIEGASDGKGLGFKFLKHIERTKAFIHLVDCSWCLEPYEAFESYVTIRSELEKYGRDLSLKKEVICLTKIDAMTREELNKFVEYFEQNLEKKIMPISAVSGKNIDPLKNVMARIFKEFKQQSSNQNNLMKRNP